MYANAPLNKMDNDNNDIASAARALCTLHDDNHLPITDCDSELERIFGTEGIIDRNDETLTYFHRPWPYGGKHSLLKAAIC
jgi:hypothetical protein